MADSVSKAKRSDIMARVGSKDTKPELLIRRGLHARGFRFRLHDRKLPGKPDMVFPRYRSVIHVNGCFWHGHSCRLYRFPKTNRVYWREKIRRNIERDSANVESLRAGGWRILKIWECCVKGKARQPVEKVLSSASEWLLSETPVCEISGLWEE